ncbi:phosphotransferase family protein [Halosegnis sp.]|uniref:phosphotransferase family protein n=1 Tax=Halosegnis sp. TaxID=2864959 RepID=UPI0035D458E5
MDQDVERALRAAFPDRRVVDVEGTGPSWNEANETVRVTFADGAAYLKVARDGDGTRFSRERAVAAYVRANTAVPAPEILASAPDGDPPYLVTAPIDGTSALTRWNQADDAARHRLVAALGRSLARLHKRRFDGHGRFTGGGADSLAFERRPWPNVLADDVRYMREAASDPRFPGYYDDLLAAIDTNRDQLSGAPAALCHGDPARPNAVFVDRRLGLLDWERSHAGDPARELYRARDQWLKPLREEADPTLVDAYRDGYRSVAGGLPDGYERRRPVYEAIRLTGPVGFFENYLALGDIEESEFADWLAAKMERRLARL